MERRAFLQWLSIAPISSGLPIEALGANSAPNSLALSQEPRLARTLLAAAPSQFRIPHSWSIATVPTPQVAGKSISQGLPSNCKHTRWAYRPVDEKWYVCGGDYPNAWGGQSACSAMWAYHPASRAWDLVYPYRGHAGEIQAIACDEVAWAYDSRRDLFWKVTGFQYWSPSRIKEWPGPSIASVQEICTFGYDAKLGRWRWRRVAGFGEWNVVGPNPTQAQKQLQTSWNNMKYGVYDPVTDAIWIGYGTQLYRLDCSTLTFHTFRFSGQFTPGARLGGTPTGTYAIDPTQRKIWITDPGSGGTRYTHGRIFTVDISNPDAPVLSKLCDFPPSWREIDPAWNQTWFVRQCYDTQLVYMASRGLLFLWGPSERTPDSILVDVNTGKIHDGPDLPRNAAGTKDCVLRMAQYDAPRDRIICGWSQGKPGEWGVMQDVYWIYTPKDGAGSMRPHPMGLA